MDKILRPGLFILLFVLVGVYAFVFGESGILERRHLEQGKQNLVEHLRSMQTENSALRDKLERLRGEGYPADLMNSLGYVREGEKVVRVQGADKTPAINEKKPADEDNVTLFHFRIAWVIFSIFAVLVYLWYYLKQEDSREL